MGKLFILTDKTLHQESNSPTKESNRDQMVVHCKRDKYDVYIGRPSIWGNPFPIDAENSRDKVIQQYKDYLLHNPYLMARLPDLKGKVLGCWCRPEACHGDVILEVLSTLGNSG